VYYIAAAERDRRQARIDNELAETPEGKLILVHRRMVALVGTGDPPPGREAKNGGVDPARLQKLTGALANLNRVPPPALPP
jgi:hypothetical protein